MAIYREHLTFISPKVEGHVVQAACRSDCLGRSSVLVHFSFEESPFNYTIENPSLTTCCSCHSQWTVCHIVFLFNTTICNLFDPKQFFGTFFADHTLHSFPYNALQRRSRFSWRNVIKTTPTPCDVSKKVVHQTRGGKAT